MGCQSLFRDFVDCTQKHAFFNGDSDDFETILGEAISKIDELIDGPLVPFFAIGLTLAMVMFALPFLMMSSMMIFIPFLMTFTIPFLMIGPIMGNFLLALNAV